MSIPKITGQGPRVASSEDLFYKLVTRYDVFIDKTLFIKDIIDSSEKAILITYPRRWGKSLNLDTLKVFFEIESENHSKTEEKKESYLDYLLPEYFKTRSTHDNISVNKKLFTDHNLKITKVSDGQYMQHQGKYPVIFLSLKDVTGESIEEITDKLKIKVKELYRKFRYLTENSELYDDEKNDFQKYITMDYNGISLENSIQFLSELLYNYHKEAVYVLVDEYDTPVSKLLEDHLGEKHLQFPEKVSELISQMVCSSISKTNPYVEKLILTGVFDTTYKGTTSGCNNIRSYGISDKRFSESFGFTTKEIKTLINKFKGKAPFDNKEKIFGIIKDWYGGYFVPTVAIGSSTNYLESDGQTHAEVFAPWAVMNFLSDSNIYKELRPKTYWSDTGYKTILSRLFTQEKCKDSSLSKKFLEISKNVIYELKFYNQISLFKYDWYSDVDNEAFFSHILLNTGYLAGKEEDGIFKLSIPNRELLKEFTNLLEGTKGNRACGIILENLQKNRQLKILEMIKKDDPSEDFISKFNEKFTSYNINCADSSMNFNYISLAIIYNNTEVFNSLKILCGRKSLGIPDDANDFTALDYNVVLQRDFIDATTNHTQFYYDNVNNKLYDLVCGALTNYCSGTIISTIPGWMAMTIIRSIPTLFTDNRIADFFEQHTTIATGAISSLALLTLAASKVLSDYLPTKKYCQEYTDYQKINITKPDEFTTLKHIKKYVSHHNNIYIVIDRACLEKEDTITEIPQSVFKHPYGITENIKFTICKKTAYKQEKSQYNAFIMEPPTCTNIDYPQEELAHGETDQPDV
jgi:hypothetical protein